MFWNFRGSGVGTLGKGQLAKLAALLQSRIFKIKLEVLMFLQLMGDTLTQLKPTILVFRKRQKTRSPKEDCLIQNGNEEKQPVR